MSDISLHIMHCVGAVDLLDANLPAHHIQDMLHRLESRFKSLHFEYCLCALDTSADYLELFPMELQ